MHLKYLCEKTLQKNIQQLEPLAEQRATQNLIGVIQSRNERKLEQFLFTFINQTEHPTVIHALRKLLHLLISDAAMTSFIPVMYHTHLLETCAKCRNGENIHKHQEEMKEYGVELSNLIMEGVSNGCEGKCIDVLEYLVDEIINVHSCDRLSQPATVVENSYNPEMGTAYYFTPHGHQVRKQPSYAIDQAKRNYDDMPTVDDMCIKKFPSVSYGGSGYISLWFCPIHGHCYGFHSISGGEGRKDPFSSIYKYLPKAPSDIFYDFACQLSEYCLNREPQYFIKTRFWHDLFHGITHKCGKCFKSSRICGMVGLNSDISEEFNSYLQCVKYTGSHLS